MGILEGDHVVASIVASEFARDMGFRVYLLNFLSSKRSLPPLMLSARNTFPVVAIATILECSLKGLNEIGSWISPDGFRE